MDITSCLLGFVLFLVFLRCVYWDVWPSPRVYWYSWQFDGPRGWPFVGMHPKLAFLRPEKMLDYLTELSEKYRRACSMYAGAFMLVILWEPEDIQPILSSMSHIKKGLGYKPMVSWLNQGLLLSSGDKWKSRRKLLTPAFHFRILGDSLAGMNRNAGRLVSKLKAFDSSDVDVDDLITSCTLNVMADTAMGVKLEDKKKEGAHYTESVKWLTNTLLERIVNQIFFYDYPFFWFPSGREYLKRLDIIHSFTQRVIKEKKAEFVSTNNSHTKNKRLVFLDCLLETEASSPGMLSDLDIREEVDTFMFEGHDTTASALTMTLYSIGMHHEVQAKLHEEMDEIFGDSEREVTMEDTSKMVYLEKVIKETLRLYPSVPVIMRELTSDCVLNDGLLIPRGTNISISIIHIHRNPRFYPDPDKFDPERFSEDQVAARHPFAYLPFSAGPRNCIGQKFAMVEMKTVLSSVIRKFTIEPTTKNFQVLPQLILRSDRPILCKFHPR